MVGSQQSLALNKTFSTLLRRFIPTKNIVFMSFSPSITTPYGKDANGIMGDTVFLPCTLKAKVAKFQRVSYGAFVTTENLHTASGLILNIYKAQSVSFVDAKMEIADVAYHSESMVTNSMIDALNYMESDLLSQAINGIAQVNSAGGTATGKLYKKQKITERSSIDEISVDKILDKNLAKFMTERIEGTLAFGTNPIPLSYIEITNVNGASEIAKTYASSGNFISSVKYGMATRSMEAVNNQRFEAGYIAGSKRRIFITENFPKLDQETVDGGTDKVYSSLIMGADAFYIYLPPNRLIETQLITKQITDSDKSGDKIRFIMKLTYGLVNDVYGHALHFLYLGAQ